MIHFAIQDHGLGQNLPALVDLLSDDECSIDVSFDGSDEALNQVRHNLSGGSALLTIRRSAPVSWSSWASAQVILDSMINALRLPEWSYFMNLSGSCLPLLSPQDMRERLDSEAGQGRMGFCTAYRLARPVCWISSQAPAAPLSHGLEYAQGRARMLVDPSLRDLVESQALKPPQNIGQRIGLVYTETGKNSYSVRPLSPTELCSRVKFAAVHPIHYGRSWVILHRSIVEWLVSSSILTRVQDFLKDCFVPDEMLFPMTLFSHENPFLEGMSPDNLRYHQGGARRLDLADVPDLAQAQSHLIARKVFPADYPIAADLIRRHQLSIA